MVALLRDRFDTFANGPIATRHEAAEAARIGVGKDYIRIFFIV